MIRCSSLGPGSPFAPKLNTSADAVPIHSSMRLRWRRPPLCPWTATKPSSTRYPKPNGRYFRRQIELAAGFWLGFIFSPSPRPVAVLRRRVEQIYRLHASRVRLVRPSAPEELREILPRLLEPESVGAGCIWVEAVHLDASTFMDEKPGPWATSWMRREGLFSVPAACLFSQPPINTVEAIGVLFATLLPFRLRRKRPPLIQRGVGHLVDHLRLAELVLRTHLEARRQDLPVVPYVPPGGRQQAGDAARRGGLPSSTRPPPSPFAGHVP